MQKPQIPIFMEITDAEWDEMVRLLCLREKKFKKKYDYFSSGRHHRRNGNCYKRKRKYRKCGHFR